MRGEFTGEVSENLTPRPPLFKNRSPVIDCMKCWPRWGWGHRPTRKGRKNFDSGVKVGPDDIKGPCFTCAGTGQVAIPFADVVQSDEYWDAVDVQEWQES
jgi:hypothetical protein